MQFIPITSNSNPEIKLAKSLQQKKFRDKQSLFLAEGDKIILEACKSSMEFVTVFVLSTKEANYEDLLEQIMSKNPSCKLYLIHQAALDTMSSTKAPQPIIATIKIPSANSKELSGSILILESIQDPSNMGSIIRSADALGASGIIYNKECADVYSPKCIRSAMGSTFHLPIVLSESLSESIANLKNQGFFIIATDIRGKTETDLTHERTALIIGNEGNGISDELLSIADMKFRLEMKGNAESLNASVAAALCMHLFF